MTDSNPSHFTSGLNESSSVRARNHRLPDEEASKKRDLEWLGAFSAGASRSGSPLPSRRASRSPNRHDEGNGNIGQFLNESLYSSWSSVAGFATSLLGSGELPGKSGARSASHARAGARGRQHLPNPGSLRTTRSWGPAPPTEQPGLGVITGGTLADREAALKAARTASVLESHDGVNGGLDVAGRHKRRNSDDVKALAVEAEEVLVYVHWVQSSDTYQGLILRYKCREDAFRQANGLWSRDTIQTRKWLAIPVDACELRGRPCDPPAWYNEKRVDLLAPTPKVEEDGNGKQNAHDDFFSRPLNDVPADANKSEDEGHPWTHVRWVKVDSLQHPIEIARVPRQAIGYFPPRRRKSIRTYSTLSTPRQSLDLSSNPPGSIDGPSSRRESSLGSRPQLSSTPVSTRSRMNSGGTDTRPMWMRRPGGVGSLSKTVRAPGPEKDYFNTFTKKHIPGLNIEGPSMSIMGSETAHFGFGQDSAALVESPYEEGRDATSSSRQGTGLDKAAAAVEMWLRGALAKRPSTPMMSGRARFGGRTDDNDLIELTDTASDDGKLLGDSAMGLLDQPLSSTGWSGGEGSTIRGRGPTSGGAKGPKDD